MKLVATAGVIAAVYVVLTVIFAAFSFGEVQVRVSEAMTILPYFTPAAIPGLFAGCILANFLGGGIPLDIAFGTWLLCRQKKNKFLAPVPPILANTVIVPFVLRYGYGLNAPIPLMMLTVGIGEVISCGVLGMLLLTALEKLNLPYLK